MCQFARVCTQSLSHGRAHTNLEVTPHHPKVLRLAAAYEAFCRIPPENTKDICRCEYNGKILKIINKFSMQALMNLKSHRKISRNSALLPYTCAGVIGIAHDVEGRRGRVYDNHCTLYTTNTCRYVWKQSRPDANPSHTNTCAEAYAIARSSMHITHMYVMPAILHYPGVDLTGALVILATTGWLK